MTQQHTDTINARLKEDEREVNALQRNVTLLNGVAALVATIGPLCAFLINVNINQKQDAWQLTQQAATMQQLTTWKPQTDLRLQAVETQRADIAEIKSTVSSLQSSLINMQLQQQSLSDKISTLINRK